MKTCTKCQQTKPFSDYRSRKDGLHAQCKDCHNKKNKEYRANNRNKLKEYIKGYHKRPEIKERRREQNKNNPQKRLNDKMTKETKNVLLGVYPGMTPVSEEYGIDKVGLTSPQYRAYIESLWTEGMSWDNYGRGGGKWCIDHKRPKNSYDLTDQELYRKCSHYTNTQPMWYADNVAKGDKLLD